MKDRRKSSIPNLRATSIDPSSAGIYHVRTKSENKCCDLVADNLYLQRRRSISKPNENYTLPTRTPHNDSVPSNSSFADRILNELQNISIKQIMVCNDDNYDENSKNKIKEITIRKADPKEIQNLSQQQTVDVNDKSKKVSKLTRPKSYPSKEQEIVKKISPDKTGQNVLEKIQETTNDKNIRPKSYPTAKIASSKEIKSSKNSEVPFPTTDADKSNDPDAARKSMMSKSGVTTTTEQTTKKNKIPKKNEKSNTIIDQPMETDEPKAPEKKQKTGFLHSIGQKFEKLRENSKNKVLRKSNNKLVIESQSAALENLESNGLEIALNSSSNNNQNLDPNQSDQKSTERKSRIDAMIRNLRERSVTRGPTNLTESGLIKRAVSVEDISDTFNKCSVNKVLGLFRKFENSNVQNTKSSSIIDSIVRNEKERPKSSEYMSKQKNGRKYSGAKSDTIVTLTDLDASPPISLDKMNGNASKIPVKLSSCRDCSEEVDSTIVTKRHSSTGPAQTAEDKERMKQNRKGLVLDFNKIENGDAKHPLTSCKNNNNNNNNHSTKSINYNNNTQASLHPNGILSPSYDSLTNYSSDSRSIHDDCASTSTFLSPTDEPELYFDDWSICSEDNNFTGTTPSPSLSRLSRNSQSSLMGGDANTSSESVIDRIKRRSFYCRFNENKPKRQSNIVGPAAREYYREAAAKLKSRPPDRVSSPPVMEAHEYYRQSKQKQNTDSKSSTPSSIKSKYDNLKSSHRHSDYLLPKSNLNLNLPLPTSSSSRRIPTTDNDYKYGHNYLQNGRSSVYEPSNLYGTYHSKIKPSSYTTTNGSSCLDSYATLGRKPRSYDQRSKSLMDSSIITSANNSTYKREHRGTVEYGTLTRPSMRYRTSSISRSPTNL